MVNPILLKPVDTPTQTVQMLEGLDMAKLELDIAIIRDKILKKEPLTIHEERMTMIWARAVTGRTFASVRKEKPVKEKKVAVKAPAKRTALAVKKDQTKDMSAADLLDLL